MNTILEHGRRIALIVLTLALFASPMLSALAEVNAGQDLLVPTTERIVKVRLFAVPGPTRRPAVLLLHGAGAIDPAAAGFRNHVAILNQLGIDAYAVYYYSDADLPLMSSPDHAIRSRTFVSRLDAWAKLVSEVGAFVRARPENSGRIGLLGFSNGGTLALNTAGMDPGFSALVTYYGSFPTNMKFRHLPPLLALHGEADSVIPIGDARYVIKYAQALGGYAELLAYPGMGHGFDSEDARIHAGMLFRQRLF